LQGNFTGSKDELPGLLHSGLIHKMNSDVIVCSTLTSNLSLSISVYDYVRKAMFIIYTSLEARSRNFVVNERRFP
jgi:hypothetical protein